MMDMSGLGEAVSIDREDEQTSLLAAGAQESSASLSGSRAASPSVSSYCGRDRSASRGQSAKARSGG
jgi:hypothetical protein